MLVCVVTAVQLLGDHWEAVTCTRLPLLQNVVKSAGGCSTAVHAHAFTDAAVAILQRCVLCSLLLVERALAFCR